MCHNFHGAAFATFGEAKRVNFHWLEGEKLLQSYLAENGTVRKFCKECGSSMIFAASADSSEEIEFSLGTLDSPLDIEPDVHISFSVQKLTGVRSAMNFHSMKEIELLISLRTDFRYSISVVLRDCVR